MRGSTQVFDRKFENDIKARVEESKKLDKFVEWFDPLARTLIIEDRNDKRYQYLKWYS